MSLTTRTSQRRGMTVTLPTSKPIIQLHDIPSILTFVSFFIASYFEAVIKRVDVESMRLVIARVKVYESKLKLDNRIEVI